MAVQGVGMDIVQALVNMIMIQLRVKDFAIGSKGFHATAKITVDGIRYHAQAQAVLVGSKHDSHASVEATTEEIGAVLGQLVATRLGPEDLQQRPERLSGHGQGRGTRATLP